MPRISWDLDDEAGAKRGACSRWGAGERYRAAGGGAESGDFGTESDRYAAFEEVDLELLASWSVA